MTETISQINDDISGKIEDMQTEEQRLKKFIDKIKNVVEDLIKHNDDLVDIFAKTTQETIQSIWEEITKANQLTKTTEIALEESLKNLQTIIKLSIEDIIKAQTEEKDTVIKLIGNIQITPVENFSYNKLDQIPKYESQVSNEESKQKGGDDGQNTEVSNDDTILQNQIQTIDKKLTTEMTALKETIHSKIEIIEILKDDIKSLINLKIQLN